MSVEFLFDWRGLSTLPHQGHFRAPQPYRERIRIRRARMFWSRDEPPRSSHRVGNEIHARDLELLLEVLEASSFIEVRTEALHRYHRATTIRRVIVGWEESELVEPRLETAADEIIQYNRRIVTFAIARY